MQGENQNPLQPNVPFLENQYPGSFGRKQNQSASLPLGLGVTSRSLTALTTWEKEMMAPVSLLLFSSFKGIYQVSDTQLCSAFLVTFRAYIHLTIAWCFLRARHSERGGAVVPWCTLSFRPVEETAKAKHKVFCWKLHV